MRAMRIHGGTSRTALVARLTRAKDRQERVRITRDTPGAYGVAGYVLDIGAKWFLVADVDVAGSDGFVALRLRDVERVWRAENDELHRRAQELRGTWPPAGPASAIDLDTTRSLIRDAGAAARLIAVHTEYEDPEALYVGVPEVDESKRFLLVEVSENGRWEDQVGRWSLGVVSRVDFGGRYEELLADLAGPRPDLS